MNPLYLRKFYIQIVFSIIFIVNVPCNGQFLEGGVYNSFIICEEGNILGHGTNSQGQMGNPGYNPGIVNPQLLVEGSWIRVAAGFDHTLFLHSDSSVWAAGSNTQGALGIGELPGQNSPVQMGDEKKWIFIEAEAYVSFGIKKDGTLWGWGTTLSGHFGSSIFNTFVPVQIGLSDKWAKISSSYTHVLALQKDSTLWGWGQNESGQLGTGNTNPLWDPEKLTGEKKWTDIAAGGNYSLGLDAVGKLWVTGSNLAGAMGLGTEILSALIWTPLEPEKSWKAIAVGANFSAAIMSDGSLWTFGGNQYGELGLGTTEKTMVPSMVGTNKDWIAIAAGATHMLAMKENGEIYSWGDNRFSQLGRGDCGQTGICSEPELLVIECQKISAVPEKLSSNLPMFYPNPFQSKIVFNDPESIRELQIFNLMGQLLHSEKNISGELDLSWLEKGIFLLRMQGEFYEKTDLLIHQ